MDTIRVPCFMLLLLGWVCLRNTKCHGSDSISGNESLSGDQTIVSAGGIFRLGFFRPGNSPKHYIGIWYNKISLQTCVWVANRDSGISDRFRSHLKIVGGNLVLLNESQSVIWSTHLSSSSSSRDSVKAILQDDGNLVVDREGLGKLWQSFDNPTHTWLPGAKIGFHKRRNKRQVLTSWRNSDDPSPGLYLLELNPNGTNSHLNLLNRSVSYWTKGDWNGNIYSLLPDMRKGYVYEFRFVSNENESYFTYLMHGSTVMTRFVIDVSGQVNQLTWLSSTKEWNTFWSQPVAECNRYALCGRYGICDERSLPLCNCLKGFHFKSESNLTSVDYSFGCVRRIPLNCGNSSGRRDKFMENPDMSLPADAHSISVYSFEECKRTCSRKCSCTAYSFNEGACSVWYDDLLDLQLVPGNGVTLHIKLNAAEFPDAKKNTGLIISIVASSVVLAVIISLVLVPCCVRRMRHVKMTKSVEGSLMAFGYRELQIATKNFSDKLGGGGFGSVFKGALPDSTAIAVKKLGSVSQGEKQFRTEVSTIGTLQHINLVRLRGFCSEGTKRLLVYDYMPNGSLEAHLFHDTTTLNWQMRYQIALGTARGLNYLHEKCRECIIHCDIKPENILLDSEFCPKVADFGLAKLIGRDFSRVLTTMRGTRGYLAPEWISGVAVTAKADVYSYGMMLFELVSGKRNFDHGNGRIEFFPTHAANMLNKGGFDVLTITDRRLEGEVDADEVAKALKVAGWCVQDDEADRPSMGQVVQILEGVVGVDLPPVPRSLQMFVEGNQERSISFMECSASGSSGPVHDFNFGDEECAFIS